jgi:Restriction endonuclease
VKKNTGTAYEILTQEVFSRLHAQDGLCTDVQRNIFLKGKAGAEHQIDVTFVMKIGGIDYRTIVQCKDWGAAVKQGQVLEFQQVLSEIAGQPRGIMVSRSGFQEGARTIAAHHGIKLYELREPRDEDWEGLIRAFDITMNLSIPRFDKVELKWNEALIKAELLARDLPDLKLQLFGVPSATYASGEPCDFDQILNGYVNDVKDEPLRVRHAFDEVVWVDVPDCPLPRLPLEAIEATIRVSTHTEKLSVSLDHLVAYCFRDVLASNIRFLDANGGPVGNGGKA